MKAATISLINTRRKNEQKKLAFLPPLLLRLESKTSFSTFIFRIQLLFEVNVDSWWGRFLEFAFSLLGFSSDFVTRVSRSGYSCAHLREKTFGLNVFRALVSQSITVYFVGDFSKNTCIVGIFYIVSYFACPFFWSLHEIFTWFQDTGITEQSQQRSCDTKLSFCKEFVIKLSVIVHLKQNIFLNKLLMLESIERSHQKSWRVKRFIICYQWR